MNPLNSNRVSVVNKQHKCMPGCAHQQSGPDTVKPSADFNMSRLMGKPTICIGENKGTDQLRSNCEADQRLCFRYTDSTIPLLSKSKISSL